MDAKKQKRLEAAGWTLGNAADLLRLSPEEAAYVEMKIALARAVEAQRKRAHLSQHQLAQKLGTRQPNITRMENKPEQVTLDTLVRTLLALGESPRKVASLLVA